MAYIQNYRDEEDDQQPVQARTTSGVVDGTTTQAAASDSPNPTDASAPGSGAGFTNLGAYLANGLNKGVGAQLASEATKGLSSQVQNYETDAQKAAKTDFSPGGRATDAQRLKSGVQQDATGNLKEAQSFLKADYAGPTASGVISNAGLQGRADQLKTDLTGFQSNRDAQATALQDAYGKNGLGYTQGFANLDQFLMQGDQSGRDALAATAAKSGDVQSALDRASSQLSTKEAAARAQLKAGKDALSAAALKQYGADKAAADRSVNMFNDMWYNPSNVGAAKASYGDVVGGKFRTDLDALAALSGQDQINWTPSYQAGAAPTPPTTAPLPANPGSAPESYEEHVTNSAAGGVGGDQTIQGQVVQGVAEGAGDASDYLKKKSKGLNPGGWH